MPVLKLILEYDGTHYHGWQKQPYLATVQGTIEKALSRLTGRSIEIHGAGRTDAGVHALGQVAHFSSNVPFQADVWVRGLNALLPEDIVVLSAERVSDSFHARFSAKGKRYLYFIHNAPRRSPLRRETAWHLPQPLNLRRMRLAARQFTGEYDFTSFCAAAGEAKDRRVDLKKVEIRREGEEIRITFEASRFLQYMVRNIVGYLVEVGRGRRSEKEVLSILNAKDRRCAGPTAPAHGLFLGHVEY